MNEINTFIQQGCIKLIKSDKDQQISILLWFLKIMWHEDWSNDAENTALITGINYILKYIQTEIKLF